MLKYILNSDTKVMKAQPDTIETRFHVRGKKSRSILQENKVKLQTCWIQFYTYLLKVAVNVKTDVLKYASQAETE